MQYEKIKISMQNPLLSFLFCAHYFPTMHCTKKTAHSLKKLNKAWMVVKAVTGNKRRREKKDDIFTKIFYSLFGKFICKKYSSLTDMHWPRYCSIAVSIKMLRL